MSRGPGVGREGRGGVYLLLVLQQLLASGTHIVAKVITQTMDALTLTLVRSVISALLMTALLVVFDRIPRIAPADRMRVLLVSFLAIPINQFLFLLGMHYTIPSNAALLYATTPILVLLFSRLLLGERLTRQKVVGVVIAFAGVLIVIFERGMEASMQYVLGNVLVGLAVVAWALYTVLGKPLIMRYGAVGASSTTLILGTLLFLPVGILPALRYPYATLDAPAWGEILYLAIITSVASYFLWYFVLSRIEAGKAALFTNLQPVLTTVLMVVLLGQDITPQFVAGGLLAMSGVVVAQFG